MSSLCPGYRPWQTRLLTYIILILSPILPCHSLVAQITPNGFGTHVERSGHTIHIRGGKRGGHNLFHSFEQFNVHAGEIANFWTQADIRNILARVNGGSASYINGLLQVLGGPSNLYLMNPAGILFGPQAQLNVPAAFIATTARQVQFPGGVFEMSTTHVDTLTGNPLALMNFGNSPLRVEGSHLHAPGGIALLAGSAGLSVNGAHITTNQGLTLTSRANGLVEIRTQGHLLSFEVKADQLAQATSPYQLPELLTNGGKLELRDSHLTGAHISMQGGSIHLANTHIRGDTVKVGDRTTNTLTLDNQATIRSSAGVVELIAKNTTFAGTIENPGGFVEVSGTEVLHFTGVVQAANLLIDPSHLWIIESIYQVPSGVSILTPSALVTLLQGGNITISATNEIKIPYVGSPLDFTGVPSGRSLTLQNATTITVERGFVNTNNLNFTIQATSTANVSLVPTESLTLNGGNLFISAPTVNLQFNSLAQIENTNNNVAVGPSNLVSGAGNRVYGSTNSVTGNNNVVYGNNNAVFGNNNTVNGSSNTVGGSGNSIGGPIPTGSFSIGGVSYNNTSPTLTPPSLLPPYSSAEPVVKSTPEGDTLLQTQRPPVLPIPPSLTPLEQVTQTDLNFQTQFGLMGLEPVNTFSVSQIQELLEQAAAQGRGRTALLYWWLRDGTLTVAAVLPKGIAQQTVFVQTVNVSAGQIAQVVDAFVATIKDPRQRRITSYRGPARQLYSWLVAPLEPVLAQSGINTLVIVADETLRTIPYRALWDGQQHLIEKYRLAQIPSINLVNWDLVARSPIQATLAMGASEFGGLQPPLPAVPLELQQVAQLTRGQTKLNQEFTLQNFLQAWRSNLGFTFHLATHAEFSPVRNYIQFFDGAQSLEALQRRLPVNPAELVVLSACRTAIGSPLAELGFTGMAVRLGAKRAIGSLWYVEDMATFALMYELYRQLPTAQSLPMAEALRQAQIAMIRGQVRIQNQQLVGDGYRLPLPPTLVQHTVDFAHPYYWAGFNLVGNPW